MTLDKMRCEMEATTSLMGHTILHIYSNSSSFEDLLEEVGMVVSNEFKTQSHICVIQLIQFHTSTTEFQLAESQVRMVMKYTQF